MENQENLIKVVQSFAREMNILIVDDSRTMLELNKRSFGDFFQTCHLAHNGQEAYELWQENKNFYDLIVSDVVMPKMDGLELVQKIREESLEQSIIIVTSSKDLSTNQELSLYYIDGILPKPMDPDKLYILLYRVLKKISDKKDMKDYHTYLENVQFDFELHKKYICQVVDLLSQDNSTHAQESMKILKKIFIKTSRDIGSIKGYAEAHEKKEISQELHTILRRSSTQSNVSALEYLSTLDDTVMDKVDTFEEILNELSEIIYQLENSQSKKEQIDNIIEVMNRFLGVVESLGVFAILARSFVEMNSMLDSLDDNILADEQKVSLLVMALLNIEKDLNTWVNTVFINRDTPNIHYFDASFANSCLELESLLKNVEFESDEDDLEFF
jgi:CheY-like chemotaxis protein